jgi:hypothetical protein
MEPLTGKEAATRVQGMINPKYQIHGYAVDLTVRNIYSIDPVGQVDFGGSEYVSAGKIAVVAQRRQREDKYQWYDLGRGAYFVQFNETLELAEDELAVLEPDDRLLRAGAGHGTLFLRGRVAPIETLLFVDAIRTQIKQNARLSRVRVFRFTPARAPIEPVAKWPLAGPKKVRKRKR